MPLEKRFGKRLQRAATGDDDEGTPAAPLQKRGRPMGKYQGVLCLGQEGRVCPLPSDCSCHGDAS